MVMILWSMANICAETMTMMVWCDDDADAAAEMFVYVLVVPFT